MNYLSHYYFDQEDKRSDYILGCMFPDLLSGYKRKLKTKELVAKKLPQNFPKSLSNLQEGINRHHYLDRIFHTSPFFEKHTNTIKQQLIALNLKGVTKYYYFYAHILLELVLDRFLLQTEPHLVNEFYKHLNADSHHQLIKEYLGFFEMEQHQNKFLEYYNRFVEKKYIQLYAKDNMLVKALNKVHQRINPKEMLQSDLELIEEELPAIESFFEKLNFEDILHM